MSNFESLTIFYPMWNEEDTIERAVKAAFEAGDALIAEGEISRYDVLIIDDASTDRTPELADALALADPRVSVVHHPTNRKLGGSLKTGFAHATGELVLYTDADLPFDMAETLKAVRLLRIYQADIVSAYRFDRTGEGARRLVYSYIYNHLIQTVFGLRLRDMNFAFKLVRRSIFDHIELRSEGSFIDVELLARAQKLGFSRLFPPHPRHLHALLELGDPEDPARDVRSALGAAFTDPAARRGAAPLGVRHRFGFVTDRAEELR